MIEPDRVLRPVREAESTIARLDTYESPAVLTEALRATWHAIEQSLRTLLRSDDGAPDPIRLTAMSPTEMPTETLLRELRRRDLVSLPLAGRIHEFEQVLDRAASGDVRAADADVALDTLRLLEAEVHRLARSRRSGAGVTPGDVDLDGARTVDAGTAGAEMGSANARGANASAGVSAGVSGARARTDAGTDVDLGAGISADRGGGMMQALRAGPHRPLWVVGGVILLLVIIAALLFTRGGGADLERGVEAFREGRAGIAEQHFRSALSRDADNVTARLYLARILREQARLQEAAELLRRAAQLAPEDAAVRRELGYLFLDLNRPPSAVEQFRTAVELEPEESLNWVGLVVALRRAGDGSADEWLRRAPAEARAMLGSTRP